MAVQNINPVIERQARLLAADNRQAEPGITRIFWFPDATEVRLVELFDDMPANMDEKLHPFYFRASPQDDLPAPTVTAMIRAEEYGALKLPEGWGNWSDAVEL